MEHFSRLPRHVTDVAVNSAVFLLNTCNIGLKTGSRGLLYRMSLLHLLPLAASHFTMHLTFGKALDVKAAESYHLPFCMS